jgi:hypothetical protein
MRLCLLWQVRGTARVSFGFANPDGVVGLHDNACGLVADGTNLHWSRTTQLHQTGKAIRASRVLSRQPILVN